MTIYNGTEFGKPKSIHEDTELLLDLLYGAVEAEGYNVKGYGETRLMTTASGGLLVERNGVEFHVTVSRKEVVE